MRKEVLALFLFILVFLVACEQGIKGSRINQADFNDDGCVGFDDFVQFSSAFGSKQGDVIYDSNPREDVIKFKQAVDAKVISEYDFDSNGLVDFPDFAIFSQNYGKGCGEEQPELDASQLGQQPLTKTAVDCDAYDLEDQRNECWIIKAGWGDSSLCDSIIDSESEQNEENLKCICRQKVDIGLERDVDNSCAQVAEVETIELEQAPVEYEYILNCNTESAQKIADLYCGESGAHSYETGKTTRALLYLPSNRVVVSGENRDYISAITCYVKQAGGFSLVTLPTVREPTMQEPSIPLNIPAPRRISSCYEEKRIV